MTRLDRTAALLAATLTLLVFGAPSPALAGTAFLVGEETGTFAKTCYYDYLGERFTREVSSVAFCPLSIQVRMPTLAPSMPSVPVRPGPSAFFVREEVGGLTKVCYYDYLGDQYTTTISSAALCPLTIRVR